MQRSVWNSLLKGISKWYSPQKSHLWFRGKRANKAPPLTIAWLSEIALLGLFFSYLFFSSASLIELSSRISSLLGFSCKSWKIVKQTFRANQLVGIYIMETLVVNGFLANIYLFKANNRNTRKRYETCSKLTMKTRTTSANFWCFERWNQEWEWKNIVETFSFIKKIMVNLYQQLKYH